MIKKTWLILALAIITVMSLVTYAGVTQSFFSDNEDSSDDRLGIRWGYYTINDGFENTGNPAWDDKWDDNGITEWVAELSLPGIFSPLDRKAVRCSKRFRWRPQTRFSG